jgi:GNAT superfamily N-acetyltransferase
VKAPPALSFSRVTDPAAPEMDALLAIYEQAIPAAERKSESAVRAMATSQDHVVEVAVDTSGVAGCSLLYVGRGLSLLEYLAVDANRRGSGVGAALFQRAASVAPPLLIEVESDREEVPDQALRARRIAFYRRLGCRRLDGLSFVLPLPGAEPALLLDLLVTGWVDPTISRSLLRKWLTAVYVGVYGCKSDDPSGSGPTQHCLRGMSPGRADLVSARTIMDQCGTMLHGLELRGA